MNKGEVEYIYINGILWPGPPPGHFYLSARSSPNPLTTSALPFSL